MPGAGELVFIVGILLVLYITGLLPVVMQALREIRGGGVSDAMGGSLRDLDLAAKMLGISSSASLDEIEQAYRRKARIHHPDHGGDEDTMRALNDAYRLLKRLKRGPGR